MPRSYVTFSLLAAALTASPAMMTLFADEPPVAGAAEKPAADNVEKDWKPLFDGKTLGDWKSIAYGGEGQVEVKDGSLHLPFGDQLTGVVREKEFPKTNYELRWEAKKVDGSDFFSAATFPVADSHCTLVNGGWGGGVVGLSSLDGYDAAENETTEYLKFEKDRWYRFRVRVTPERIEAWIDDKSVVDAPIEGRKIGVRFEVETSRPLGFTSYATHGALRKIEYRTLDSDANKDPAAPEKAAP